MLVNRGLPHGHSSSHEQANNWRSQWRSVPTAALKTSAGRLAMALAPTVEGGDTLGVLPIERPAVSFNCCAALDNEHVKSQQTPPRGPPGATARNICSAQTLLTLFCFSPIWRPAVSFNCQPDCAALFPMYMWKSSGHPLLTWRGGNAENYRVVRRCNCGRLCVLPFGSCWGHGILATLNNELLLGETVPTAPSRPAR